MTINSISHYQSELDQVANEIIEHLKSTYNNQISSDLMREMISSIKYELVLSHQDLSDMVINLPNNKQHSASIGKIFFDLKNVLIENLKLKYQHLEYCVLAHNKDQERYI